jgi:hypothetical protein
VIQSQCAFLPWPSLCCCADSFQGSCVAASVGFLQFRHLSLVLVGGTDNRMWSHFAGDRLETEARVEARVMRHTHRNVLYLNVGGQSGVWHVSVCFDVTHHQILEHITHHCAECAAVLMPPQISGTRTTMVQVVLKLSAASDMPHQAGMIINRPRCWCSPSCSIQLA